MLHRCFEKGPIEIEIDDANPGKLEIANLKIAGLRIPSICKKQDIIK